MGKKLFMESHLEFSQWNITFGIPSWIPKHLPNQVGKLVDLQDIRVFVSVKEEVFSQVWVWGTNNTRA